MWDKLGADRQKTLIGGLVLLVAGSGVCWGLFGSTRGPSAEVIAQGKLLFEHQWTVNDGLARGGDGLGPVFNANSCVACHSQGGVGGGGGNERNVTAFEILPSRLDPNVQSGVIHSASTSPEFKETFEQVRLDHPIVPAGVTVIGNCTVRVDDFDPLLVTRINTPTLFGAGALDQISGSSIRHSHTSRRLGNIGRELSGDFSKVSTGRVRILPDGRVGKFGWKAQFATLDEFVATACAVELGLSNPVRRQDVPGKHVADSNAALDMTRADLACLSAFCSSLETPRSILPEDPTERQLALRGEEVFTNIGCASCHLPTLGGVEGIYSDLCLHVVVDDDDPIYERIPEIPFPDDFPRPEEWKTPPLWGVADTAPYMHDGSASTLEQAILAHKGEARKVTKNYQEEIPQADRDALLTFLRTLRTPGSQVAAR